MDEDDNLRRFGVRIRPEDAEAVREILRREIRLGLADELDGHELMKLCCVQLFSLGDPRDSLLVWTAKRTDFDAGSYIDVHLLCGAGLEPTRAFLRTQASHEASEALAYLDLCVRAGNFEDFDRADYLADQERYFGVGDS